VGNDQPDLVDAVVVARQLLEARLRECANVGTDLTVASGHLDLHVDLPRAPGAGGAFG
jgi:hypothetical protein